MRYLEILIKLVEKLPFFNYLIRLTKYIINPKIENNEWTKEQLDHSLLDIVNGIGLGATLIAALILFDTKFSHLKIIEAFNPLFVVGLHLWYAFIFSVVFASLTTLLSFIPLANNSNSKKDNFYLLFTHCLRFYAIFGFFISPLYIHAMGNIILEGVHYSAIFKMPFYWILFPIIFLWFPVRLFLRPVKAFLNSERSGLFIYPAILFIAYLSVQINHELSPNIQEKLMFSDKVCKQFKKGSLYRKLDEQGKKLGEKTFCTVST